MPGTEVGYSLEIREPSKRRLCSCGYAKRGSPFDTAALEGEAAHAIGTDTAPGASASAQRAICRRPQRRAHCSTCSRSVPPDTWRMSQVFLSILAAAMYAQMASSTASAAKVICSCSNLCDALHPGTRRQSRLTGRDLALPRTAGQACTSCWSAICRHSSWRALTSRREACSWRVEAIQEAMAAMPDVDVLATQR